jgi:hypothetical protein
MPSFFQYRLFYFVFKNESSNQYSKNEVENEKKREMKTKEVKWKQGFACFWAEKMEKWD